MNKLLFYLSTFLFSQTNSIVMAFAPNSFLLLVAMPFVFGSSRLTLFERFSIVLCGSCHHSGLGHPRLVFLLVRDENTHSVFVTLKKEQCVVLCLSSRSAGQPTIVLIPAVLTDRKEGRKEGLRNELRLSSSGDAAHFSLRFSSLFATDFTLKQIPAE